MSAGNWIAKIPEAQSMRISADLPKARFSLPTEIRRQGAELLPHHPARAASRRNHRKLSQQLRREQLQRRLKAQVPGEHPRGAEKSVAIRIRLRDNKFTP